MKMRKFILLVVLNLIFLASFSQTQAGVTYFIDEDSTAGFHWPYCLYIPSSVSSNKILVISNNTGYKDDDFNVHKNAALNLVHTRESWADVLQAPLLVPVFPRYDDEITIGPIAPQYLSRGTLETDITEYSRVDLQLLAMIDHAKDGQLATMGINIDGRILMWGHSASGMFATRFVSLHPDRVHAAAFGGHGWPVSPTATWASQNMPFPYGVADFTTLTGSPFDLNSFKNVSIYCYMGENDTNGWAMPWNIGTDDAGRQDYYNWFTATFGSTASSLTDGAQQIHTSVGSTAQFVIYPGTGHEITAQIDADVLNFFLNAIGSGGGGGGDSNGLSPVAWSGFDHRGQYPNILTVTEVLGPSGARADNVLFGTYIVRGTFDLTGDMPQVEEIHPARINLGFSTDTSGGSFNAVTYVVTTGTLTGSYEVTAEFGPNIDGATEGGGFWLEVYISVPHSPYSPDAWIIDTVRIF